MKSKTTISRLESGGRLMRKTENGWVEVKRQKLEPTPDDFVPAFDPDNRVWSEEDLKKRKRVPIAVTLRRRLSLTQEQFAERYHLPIGTLRDWEQGRSEPDAPAKALLKLIAADPEGAAEKLKPVMRTAAE
jgi:putative transcriptional regulator